MVCFKIMVQKENPFTYREIRVKEEHEIAMVSLLMKSGQRFSAISKTDYLISNKQCSQLTKKNIPYTKI